MNEPQPSKPAHTTGVVYQIPYSIPTTLYANNRYNVLTSFVSEVNYTIVPFGLKLAIYYAATHSHTAGEFNHDVQYRSYFRLAIYEHRQINPVCTKFYYPTSINNSSTDHSRNTQTVSSSEPHSCRTYFRYAVAELMEALRRDTLLETIEVRSYSSFCTIDYAIDKTAVYHIPKPLIYQYRTLISTIFGINLSPEPPIDRNLFKLHLDHMIDIRYRWGKHAYYVMLLKHCQTSSFVDPADPERLIREFEIIVDEIDYFNSPYMC